MTLTIAYMQVGWYAFNFWVIVSSITGVCLRNESCFKPLRIYVWTFCPTNTRNVGTNVNLKCQMLIIISSTGTLVRRTRDNLEGSCLSPKRSPDSVILEHDSIIISSILLCYRFSVISMFILSVVSKFFTNITSTRHHTKIYNSWKISNTPVKAVWLAS